jgi:PAS domain S-box-containing protein
MVNSALHARGFRYIAGLILLALVYFVADQLELRFAVVQDNVTLMRPSAGIALAALVLFGQKLWPGVLLGALMVGTSIDLPFPPAFIIGAGYVLQAVVGAQLLRHFGFHPAIERVRDVHAFVGAATILSTTIGASLGVLALAFSRIAQPEQGAVMWLTWWAGDVIGVLTIAPILLTWGSNRLIRWSAWQWFELLALLAMVVIASELVFSDAFAYLGFYPLTFLILPFLLWIAIRFGQREAATIGLFIFVVAVWQTSQQGGILRQDNITHTSLLLWRSYTAVVTATTMLVAAIMTSHKRVERALAQERDFATQIMNAMGHGVVVTDRAGRFEYVNPAYAQMLGYHQYELIGRKTSEVSPPDNTFMSPGFLRAQAGKPLAYEAHLRRRDGTLMDALVGGTVRLREGEFNGSIVAVTDLSEIKRTEQALRQSEENTRTFLERLKALNEISMQLARAVTLDDLWRMAVELGRSRLKLDRLGVWLVDETRQWMNGSFGTDESGQTRDERAQRIPLDEASLPGLDQTLTVENLPVYFREENVLRNDRGEVVGHGWMAIGYLRDGDQVIGSIAADNLLSQKPVEPHQLAVLALYANTLGHIWKQKRAEDALRQSEEGTREFLDRLRILHALSMELARAETFDDLCRLAVELGHAGLDFERISLWFLDESEAYIIGSFGIDEHGWTHDARGVRLPRTEDNFPLESAFINIDNMQISFQEDTSLRNARGEIVGRGWRAMAYLTDSERIIGALSNDNLFSQKPMEPIQLETLALFADVLGNFCTRKRAEIAMQESEARFRSVYEGAGMGLSIADYNGHLVEFNPAYQQMLGYSRDELLHKTFAEVTYIDDRQKNLELHYQLLDGKIDRYQIEKRYIRRDGSLVWAQLSVTRFPDRAQPLVIGVVEDISRRKEAEEALRQLNNQLEQRIAERTAELQAANVRLTELDRLKTKFIADVTHELRTPLAVLNTRVYLLQRSVPEKWPAYLNDLKEQIERLTNFTNSILDLSRIELGKDKIAFSPVAMQEVARQVVAALRPRAEVAGLNLIFESQAGTAAVRGEFNQLAQVVTNLVANAINYTANGSIWVRVTRHSDTQYIRFEVQDTGIGIPQDDLPHLFNRFYRAANTAQSTMPGSGLGLSIVKEIVDLHNGEIQIESQLGVGTTVRVLLPVYEAETDESPEAAALEIQN